ncbi:MAG: universal stress protein, partial [Chloroflexi bacterium]
MLRTSVALGKDVADTLIRAAEQGEEAEGKRLTGNCDLIAMMTHGRGGLQRLSMGSVTEHVLGAAKLPLLVVYSVTTGGSNAAGHVFKTVQDDHMSGRPEKCRSSSMNYSPPTA